MVLEDVHVPFEVYELGSVRGTQALLDDIIVDHSLTAMLEASKLKSMLFCDETVYRISETSSAELMAATRNDKYVL